jgi:hypothetical protein
VWKSTAEMFGDTFIFSRSGLGKSKPNLESVVIWLQICIWLLASLGEILPVGPAILSVFLDGDRPQAPVVV